jgi:hypothetical protein
MTSESEDTTGSAKAKTPRTPAVAPPAETRAAETGADSTAEAEAVAAEALAMQAEVDAMVAEAANAHGKAPPG